MYFFAGPEFGPLEGHLIFSAIALYGLRHSGARRHDQYSNVIRITAFYPCKEDADVCLKNWITSYGHFLVYVDDLMIIGKKPQESHRRTFLLLS